MTDRPRHDVPYHEAARQRRETLQALRNDVRSSLQQWRLEHHNDHQQASAERRASLERLRGDVNNLKQDTHTLLHRYRDDLSQGALAQETARRDFIRSLKISTRNDLDAVPKMLAVFRSEHQQGSLSDAAARRQALQSLLGTSEQNRLQWQADRLEQARADEQDRLEKIRARRDDVNQNVRLRPYRADTSATVRSSMPSSTTVVTDHLRETTTVAAPSTTGPSEPERQAEETGETMFGSSLPPIDSSLSLRDQVIHYLERKPGTSLETILDELQASEDDIFEALDELQADNMIKVRNKGYYLAALGSRMGAAPESEVGASEEDLA
ncbi:MAG: hypothetical protein U5L04_14515 [Trueperaceae bacterium]|nr:hypothetical protein [Trueperaceae bacterium]